MILAIVGSTWLRGPGSRAIILGAIEFFRPTCIVSGAADGIDKLGVAIGRELGLEIQEFPPSVRQWEDRNGQPGFKSRNLQIATACHALLRIYWDPDEQRQATGKKPTFGSGWTALQAQKQGKQVVAHSLTLADDRPLRFPGYPRKAFPKGEECPTCGHKGYIEVADVSTLTGQAELSWHCEGIYPNGVECGSSGEISLETGRFYF